VLVREGQETPIPAKTRLEVKKGDVLRIESPGGGGWGRLKS
jgi:N-methylhydantoinase B